MDSKTSSTQTAALVAWGVTSAAAVALSMLNLSSITVVWAMFNQMRNLLLILLTGAYVTENVEAYLIGMKVFTFNFSFLSIGSLPFVIKVVNFFDFSQSYVSVSSCGFASESTFVNIFNELWVLLWIVSAHAA